RDDLFAGRFLFQRKKCSKRVLLAHMGCIAVENAAHFYNCPGQTNFFTKDLCAIRGRENGPADIEAHLAAINIECGHDLDVTRSIRSDLAMHEADSSAVGR